MVGASTVQQLVTVTGMKNEGNSDKLRPRGAGRQPRQPHQGQDSPVARFLRVQGFGAGKTSPAAWIDAIDGTNSIVEVKGGTLLAGVRRPRSAAGSAASPRPIPTCPA
ncbi:MAG: hypothetical protein ACLVL7_01990 [Anaerotruncus massiliensis (ex Togo et al. 2019)]